jgi:diguanylate cyclase (GGDEF)-like protein
MTIPAAGQPVAAPVDFITGLQPRAALETRLRAAPAAPAEQLALLGIDVVGLKQVNETDGFLAGDRLLAEAAAALTAATPTAALRARLGGDELVAVFTGATAAAAAAAASNTLRAHAHPTLRCGSVIRQPDEPPPQLLERLYTAIRSG